MTKYVTADCMTAEQFITKARHYGWNAISNETLVNPSSNKNRIYIAEVDGRVEIVPIKGADLDKLIEEIPLNRAGKSPKGK